MQEPKKEDVTGHTFYFVILFSDCICEQIHIKDLNIFNIQNKEIQGVILRRTSIQSSVHLNFKEIKMTGSSTGPNYRCQGSQKTVMYDLPQEILPLSQMEHFAPF